MCVCSDFCRRGEPCRDGPSLPHCLRAAAAGGHVADGRGGASVRRQGPAGARPDRSLRRATGRVNLPSLGSVSQTAAQFCAAVSPDEIFFQWYRLSVNPPWATVVSATGLILKYCVQDAWFATGSFSLPNSLPRKSRNQV